MALPSVVLRSNNKVWQTIHQLLFLWIDVVHEGVDGFREVNGGTNVHICSCGRRRGEVSGCCAVVLSSLWLHDKCDKDVFAVLDELLLVEGQVSRHLSSPHDSRRTR
jgi:hypothetical protein